LSYNNPEGNPRRIRLMGMPIDAVTDAQAIAFILSRLAQGRGGWVITPNLDHLRRYDREPELRGMYEEADLVLADGMPLLWASRLQKTPLPQRVAGSELIYTLSGAAAGAGRSIFLLGGNPGAADAAGQVLVKLSPALRVAGTHCPPMGFERSDQEIERIVQALRETRPDIVYVGLGFPKQERLIRRIRGVLPGSWFLGLGVSFSFVSGEIRQAPVWMRRTGLEWVHRMAQEPGRLFRRYVLEDVPFAIRLLGHASRGESKGRASS
jgi:N-acetylglucosaminyldiphosphoundecaprenol N-acetyl-beta-D-mannosaminyltransferase